MNYEKNKEKLIEIYKKHKDKILYIFFGGITTLVNFITYLLTTKIFHLPILLGNTVAWILSVLVAFITNRKFVFESKSQGSKIIKEFINFTLARVFSFFMEQGFLYLGIHVFYFNDFLIKIIASVFVLVFNYFASKFFIFIDKK